jgi:GT2 family glycosyltransferase
MTLAIVIINFRTPAVTLDCLASLAPQIADVTGTRVILVDNASGDDSVPQLREAISSRGWDRWIHFIESQTNRGFAGGNNFALAEIKKLNPQPKYVLLLNSDTIVPLGVLKYCVGQMDADNGVGVMSCMLRNPDQSLQNTARKLPTPARMAATSLGLPWFFPLAFAWADIEDPEWDRQSAARDVEWVGGAFMLIRRETIDRIGMLDERFFFYGEDAEFCHRASKNDFRVRYDPAVSIVHLAGASSDSGKIASGKKQAMMWQARYLLQRRCYGIAAEYLLRAVDIFSFGLRYLKLLLGGQKNTPEGARHRDVLAILFARRNRS